MPEYRYSLDAEDFSRKTQAMVEVLSSTWETLIRFLISLSAPDQLIVSLEARSAFLKDPEALKAQYSVLDQEEEEEDVEENTVINGEDNGDREEVLQDQEDQNPVPTPPSSPRNCIESSQSVWIRGRSYQTYKERINKLLSKLETNPD